MQIDFNGLFKIFIVDIIEKLKCAFDKILNYTSIYSKISVIICRLKVYLLYCMCPTNDLL